MDKRLAGLLGAAAALTAVTGAQAAASPAPGNAVATSYQDLLEPVANPVAALKADDARLAQQRKTTAEGEVAQIVVVPHHHHHHHHHHWRRRHHHHHHHHMYFQG
jgi:hypothetical protein